MNASRCFQILFAGILASASVAQAQVVTRIEVINALTQTVVTSNLMNNDILNLNVLGLTSPKNLNFVAIGDALTQSIKLEMTSVPITRLESTSPFALCGDKDNLFFNCTSLTLGSHSLTSTPYSAISGGGIAGAPYTVTFLITNTTVPAPVKAPTAAPVPAPIAPPVSPPTPAPATPVPVPAPIAAPVPASPVAVSAPIRVNMGANKTSVVGNLTWSTDLTYGFPGTGLKYKTCPAIANTDFDILFCTERYFAGPRGSKSLLKIPVSPGSYNVTLHFAETFWTLPGERVFELRIPGIMSKQTIDLIKLAGANAAYTISVKAVITTQPTIDLLFLNLVDFGKLNALEIIPTGTSTPTLRTRRF